MTIVSMALRFHEAMVESANERGVSSEALHSTLKLKVELLEASMEEYNRYGLAATNEKYRLNKHQTLAILNLLLHRRHFFD